MKLRTIMIYIVIAGLCFLSLTCKSLTGPGDNAQPGSRNYVWTIDTLPTLFQNSLGGIWGSSPSDVWCGGYKDLFRYDGTTWTHWTYIPCDFKTIFGFNSSDVWMGGDEGRIWHFDGSQWAENFVYRPDGIDNVSIYDIYGISASDVYAVGGIVYNDTTQRAFILHYDGSRWKEVYKANFQSWFIRVRVENNIAYIWGVKLGYTVSDTDMIFQFNGMIIKQIYSASEDKGFSMIDEVGGRIYFIFAHDICRYEQTNEHLITGDDFTIGRFVKQFSINDPNFDYQIYGRNEKDVFVGMQDGLAHYNGIDLQYLFRFSHNFTYTPVPAIFEKDVFFRVYDGAADVMTVRHGKLTE